MEWCQDCNQDCARQGAGGVVIHTCTGFVDCAECTLVVVRARQHAQQWYRFLSLLSDEQLRIVLQFIARCYDDLG